MVKKTTHAVRKSGYIFEYRFTFLGGKKTGKTSVLNRFLSDTFTHRYRPTIEDHITHTIDHNGNICVCLLVDTCGGDDFPAMKRLAITKGNAFLLFYAINNRRTFVEAKKTAEEIISLKDPTEDVKILLIGNKTDLEADREVSNDEGWDLVYELNNGNVSSLFFEVSAKDNEKITDIFTSLLNMFIPEQTSINYIPEKSTFSRMSFRRNSKKRELRKQKKIELLSTPRLDSNYYSDSEILDDNSTNIMPHGQLVRSSSATSHLTDRSNSSPENSPNGSPTYQRRDSRRESSAKEILRKTFGSMQKLFVKPETNLLKKSGTLEQIRLVAAKRQTTV